VPEIILQKYGCCEESLLPNDVSLPWKEYSNPALLTDEIMANATLHKNKSFWLISNHLEAIRMIDSGVCARFGVLWRSSMNNPKAPFVLDFKSGNSIMGHAIPARMGYDLDLRVLFPLNSFGKEYGDNGKFAIKFEDFDREVAKYGCYVSLDMSADIGKWLRDMNGKAVKRNGEKWVYLIKDGKKCLFTKLCAMYAYGILDEDIITEEGDVIEEIPNGEPIKVYDGSYHRILKAIKQKLENPVALDELKNELKDEFLDEA
jgi:hypothetical protein